MLNRPEPAALVIADISGYTGYLADAELDHAQDVLADLIATAAGALRPSFRLAKLEGDAIFVYNPVARLDGSAVQDTIETCYMSFRRRLRDIRQASSCDCNACILIPNLDLKFIAHHGEVVRQRIMGREELAGADVIVAHRLLKNSIAEQLAIPAYAFYSAACVAAMGLVDPAASGLVFHREEYEHLGVVEGWVRDLHAAWESRSAATRVFVEPEDAVWSVETILPAPPPVAWEWITSPARRPQWQDGVTAVLETSTTGRRGTGTTNHCMHGKNASVEEILDWRPFEYFTVGARPPVPGAPRLVITDTFEAVEGGTRHTSRLARPRTLKERAFVALGKSIFDRSMRASLNALLPMIAADVASGSAQVDRVEQPELPVSARRFETEPITPRRDRAES